MSEIRLNSIKIKNYRSFREEQEFQFPGKDYNKPVAIVGYNNCGKTNLINCILYGIGQKFVSENTFTKADLHNLNYNNLIEILTDLTASDYYTKDNNGNTTLKSIRGQHKIEVKFEDEELKASAKPSFFGAIKHYNVFYINFHCIKDEISTKKTSWGTLTSFLAKHIQKLVDSDLSMKSKREDFERITKKATDTVLKDSELSRFINSIKKNYTINLRNNKCEVVFELPEYEDVFIQMMFKVGLNCDDDKIDLVPLSHFGDGYISMFVMAVIQAIAESDTEDKCLFLFEEPESFLHENHQEYFYNAVLCTLAERGHQVIHTTHSDKMVDIFSPEGIIRLEFDESKKQTEKRYNDLKSFSPKVQVITDESSDTLGIGDFNNYIKSIEPNLNKILFSRKVLLVEGPNDLMAYKFAIERKINYIKEDIKFAKTYLSFQNIAIIPHHGKSTALVLIKLLKRINLDFFIITDWDFDEDFIKELSTFDDPSLLQKSPLYQSRYGQLNSATSKAMITTNWKLIKNSASEQIHFNVKKLEQVIGYTKNDKSSLGFWKTLNEIDEFPGNFFPSHLEAFLEFDKIKPKEEVEEVLLFEELPF